MEEVQLYHHFQLDESIQQINHDVVRMSLVSEKYYNQIQAKLKETTDVDITGIIKTIINHDYCYFIPPSSFSADYRNEHVWLKSNRSYHGVKLDKSDKESLWDYLLLVFKMKPTSGYFGLLDNQKLARLFSYLPFHYRNKSDTIIDVYRLCDDEIMKTNYKNY